MQKQKGISTLIGIIIIIAAAVVLFGGVFAYQQYAAKIPNSQLPISNKISNVQNSNTETAGYKTYIDNGFQMNYPADLNVMIAPISRTVSCDTSTFPSICPKGISPGYPDKTENQTINGVNYCFYLGDDCGAGSCTTYYSYLTVKNNTCYVLDLETGRTTNDCKVYSSIPDEQKCQTQKDAAQALMNQAMSTIKFIK